MSKFELNALSEPLSSRAGLDHAILQSLLNWGKAQANDPLDPNEAKNGWWANEFVSGVGCRDWTLARAKQTPETLARAKHYTEQALEWLITQQIAKKIDVLCNYENERLTRLITITLQDGSLEKFIL